MIWGHGFGRCFYHLRVDGRDTKLVVELSRAERDENSAVVIYEKIKAVWPSHSTEDPPGYDRCELVKFWEE